MKLLHTSDWHVGKTIRGNSRHSEHREVLSEIVKIAEDEKVDLVLISGDLFETAAPTAESEQLVYETFLRLAKTSPVAVIAGNHDNARRLRAVKPLLSLGQVIMVAEPTKPTDGGVVKLDLPNGETCKVAMLPFISQRGILKTQDLMDSLAYQNAQKYSQKMKILIEAMCHDFDDESVNIFMSHSFVAGGNFGGGERTSHISDEYSISPQSFPSSINYVALGHLHRAQSIPGPTSINYCGSPLQLDFGESEQEKQVNIVELSVGLPAKVKPVILESGLRLKTIQGTLEDVSNYAKESNGQDWLRVKLDEPKMPGLADEVREILGERVLEVRFIEEVTKNKRISTQFKGYSHQELFVEYLKTQNVESSELLKLFSEIYEQVETDRQDEFAINIAKSENLSNLTGGGN